jgi:hypothetical protein
VEGKALDEVPLLLARHHLASDEHLERFEALDVPRERFHKCFFGEVGGFQVEVDKTTEVRGGSGKLWKIQ